MVVWYGIVWCVWYSIVGIGLKVKSHGLCITWEQDTLRLTSSLCPWWFHSGPHYGCRLWFPQCEVATQAKDHGKYVRLLSSQIAKVSIHQGNIDTFESWIFHCAWDSNHYILIWSTDSWVSSYIWMVLYGIVYNFIFSPENLTLYTVPARQVWFPQNGLSWGIRVLASGFLAPPSPSWFSQPCHWWRATAAPASAMNKTS